MTELITSCRSFITGLISLVAAPAIVRAGSLMPVKAMIEIPSASVSGAWVGYGGNFNFPILKSRQLGMSTQIIEMIYIMASPFPFGPIPEFFMPKQPKPSPSTTFDPAPTGLSIGGVPLKTTGGFPGVQPKIVQPTVRGATGFAICLSTVKDTPAVTNKEKFKP